MTSENLRKEREEAMKERKGYKKAISKAFSELGTIDKKHESGTYTKAQHNVKSKAALKKLVNQVK